jgi:hypothetical protein
MSAKTNRLKNRLRIEAERAAKIDRDIEAKVRADRRVQKAEQDLHRARKDFLEKMGAFDPGDYLGRFQVDCLPDHARRARGFCIDIPAMSLRRLVCEFELRAHPVRVAEMVTAEFVEAMQRELPEVARQMCMRFMQEMRR